MILKAVVVGALQVNCYVLGCERTARAIVIDPGDDPEEISAVLRCHDLVLDRILATHAHFDHVMAARPLAQDADAPFYVHPAERPVLANMERSAAAWLGQRPGAPPEIAGDLLPGEVVQVGDLKLEVRLTSGHSPGGVTLVDHDGRRAITGDALFAGSIGRADLPGGDLEMLLANIRAQILTLPDEYAVLPGHGPATTVGEERRTNPFLAEGAPFRPRR